MQKVDTKEIKLTPQPVDTTFGHSNLMCDKFEISFRWNTGRFETKITWN